MKASEFTGWTPSIKASEMPEGTLEFMDARIFSDIIIPLREATGIAIWPSSLARAHVRHEHGKGGHYTNGKTNLSSATDFHTKSYENLMVLVKYLESMDSVGGIGIYFNTNTPMFHADLMSFRKRRLMWLVNKKGEYLYRENDPDKFAKELAKLLE